MLSKLILFLFFTYKDISVVFLFALKLHRTGQHSYFPLPQRVFWLAVSGWVPRNVGCVGAPMGSWCQGAEIRQLLQIHGQEPRWWQGWPARDTTAVPGRFRAPWGNLCWLPWSGYANKNVPPPGWASKSQHCSSSTRALHPSAVSCFFLLLLGSLLSYPVKQPQTACLAFGELPEAHCTRR